MVASIPKTASSSRGRTSRGNSKQRDSGSHRSGKQSNGSSHNGSSTPKNKPSTKKSGKRTDRDYILILHEHFHKIGKSNVGGFHWMDKNGNEEISWAEIVQTLKEAGVSIGQARAKELISAYITSDGVMDVPGYIRFMASAYSYEDGET